MTNTKSRIIETFNFLVEKYNEAESVSEKHVYKRLIKELACEHQLILRRVGVSTEAAKLAKELGLPGCLTDYHSGGNAATAFKTKVNGKEKRVFVLEHKIPKNELTDMLISGINPAEIVEMSEIVWVTRDEDNKLNEAGFKSNRPLDAYEQVGITYEMKENAFKISLK